MIFISFIHLKLPIKLTAFLLNKMNEGAVTLNHEGLILYSNSRFAEMVQLPLEKVIGLAFRSFIPESYNEDFNQLIDSAWNSDCKGELELIGSNQLVVPCLLSCNTLELDEGLALSLILTDRTKLKETERQLTIKNLQLAAAHLATEKLNNELEDTVKERTSELSISREHFKYLANNIPQMTWTNLPNGEIDYYNERWYNYTGLSFEETQKSGWRTILHPDDLQQTTEKFTRAIHSGEIFEVENRYKRNDGIYRWHLNRALPLKNDNGQILFWVGTATDIEDQKKQMERKDEFIGIASHELKTPLTSVKGYLQLVLSYKKEELPAVVKQYISKANLAVNKLQRLVNDLLDVSKIQAGMLEFAFININLSDLVKACSENAEHVYRDSNFTVIDGHNYMVKGNAERLEQVIMNMISNAVKYSPDSKNVVIKTEQTDNRIRVSVTDFGIGLSDEQIERIFERFYRVEDKKYMTSGLGMGLYISPEIIRTHDGEIGVTSELGKGSTFYFDLPLIG